MRYLALIFLAVTTIPALADDEDALKLADKATSSVETASNWHIFTEGALGTADQRYGLPTLHTQRWSLDAQYDKALAPGWRLLLSDRLDITSQDQFDHHTTINTLKEGYLSWQPSDDQIIDLGRINVRNGVATGYNPTDYFRTNALRSVVSIDPISLKKNRLGSVMMRGQKLWDGGSLTALYSPKLADQPSTAPFNADLGATNIKNRWLLSTSKKLSNNLAPQWMIFGEAHHAPQLGANLTGVLNDSTVAFAEWSGGRSRSLRYQALHTADDYAFRSRLATGLTYTTTNKITLTLEYDYNGAGLNQHDWDALRRGSPLAYGQYRLYAQNIQDPVTKQSLFFFGTWQDALINHLDLSAMQRFNDADHSRMSWLEGRYHWDHADLALQWQVNSGNAGSEFGALFQQRIIQVVGTYFF
ncbi:MAG: hypothetical protein ACXWJD_08300 [Burkholderiaceae bacterium]